MAEAEAAAPAKPRRYDLFLRHRQGLYWRLKDEGISPEAERLVFPVDGKMGYRTYADISSVNLSSAHIPRSGTFAQCLVTFRHGATLVISTLSAAGLPDASRHDTYYEFLVDFHRRLIDCGAASRIAFTTGSTPGRAMVLNVTMVVAGLMFIVVPVFAALVARSFQPLEVALGGLLFLWPAWEVMQRNQPGSYRPSDPPDLMA